MENKLKLRLLLRILRAVIDVIELELNRQIEKGIRDESWMEDGNQNDWPNNRNRFNRDAD